MKQLMAANWKMYKTRDEAVQVANALVNLVQDKLTSNREVLILPPFTALNAVSKALAAVDDFHVGGQDFYPESEGAFTGEVSPGMLQDAGARYALTGHSERRHILGESDEFVGRKTTYGLANGLSVILCVGERIEERRAGHVEAVLARQMETGLASMPPNTPAEKIVLAYEPVWAIGTGEVAGLEEILQAHAFVRKKLQLLCPAIANEIRILYGGSVKPDNASAIMALDNVDGVLVGGASLNAESFSKIVLA